MYGNTMAIEPRHPVARSMKMQASVWVVHVVTHDLLQQDKLEPRIPKANPKIESEIPDVIRIRPIHIAFGR